MKRGERKRRVEREREREREREKEVYPNIKLQYAYISLHSGSALPPSRKTSTLTFLFFFILFSLDARYVDTSCVGTILVVLGVVWFEVDWYE